MSECKRCGKDGAGSTYGGAVYHITCKLEQKLDDGQLAQPTPVQGEKAAARYGNRKPGTKAPSVRGKRKKEA